MGADSTNQKTIKSTQLTFSIIEALQEMERARFSEIAERVDTPSSTVAHHLTTLRRMGYVVKAGNEYQLGMKFLNVSESIKQSKEWYSMVGSKIDELAEKTGERVQFVVEEHGELIYVYDSRGDQAIEVGPSRGESVPMHATSIGKAILASLPPERTSELINNATFEQFTSNTICTEEELLEELEIVRERGYAFNTEEYFTGIKSVGVSITKPRGETIGALSVSGPTQRMQGERYEKKLPELLLGASNEIEVNISYS
ncbi:IclR family transcriptional regulator [Natrarchaeobius oligotrophus]|uniref:IclR family transcriptional regulator n=1 Tax=Natrarchaeobius chitinivorans TaxID=1679083 RepID=A0A3N6N024_NATCH|nr:IclR family transcriptional regulator [Natrarchaeobius chitinivorans]RQH00777.1 IclR family transcriptional regulator [Natrarchaeobius chitinivorans]